MGTEEGGLQILTPLLFLSFVQESRMCIRHFSKLFIYNSFSPKSVENNHERYSEHNIQDNKERKENEAKGKPRIGKIRQEKVASKIHTAIRFC